MKVGLSVKSNCRTCAMTTNHVVRAIETSRVSDERNDFYSSEHYAIIQCLGCDTYSFRKDYSDSETFDYDEEGYQVHETIIDTYPLVIKEHRALANTWRLPAPIRLVYDESVAAFAANCKVLAGVGCRAVIEAVCLDKKIAGRDLESKINNLTKSALITKSECDRLHSIRFIGNDSVHEMKMPTDKQLKLVMQIIEHLLSNLYLIDFEAKATLEGIINDYEDFQSLLRAKLKSLKPGDEYYLSMVFGKEYRRVKDNYSAFEAQLLKNITSGAFTKLSVGALKKKSSDPKAAVAQHFIVA